MFGYIILRDIPKKAAQLDLTIYNIQGGFRGFSQVSPGAHYVSVEVDGAMHEGFWCYLEPSGVVVRIYDYKENKFTEDTPENKAHYSDLALSGAMNRALIPIIQQNAKMATKWTKLVSNIEKSNFPPALHFETPMIPPENLSPEELSDWYLKKHKSRFEQAFLDSHAGNQGTFLAEFQFTFVRSLVRKTDNEALERWLHLIQAIYHAGERSIDDNPDLFTSLIDVIIRQLKLLPEKWFVPDSKVISGASHIIEDMIDTDIDNVVKKAQEFTNFLKSVGINVD